MEPMNNWTGEKEEAEFIIPLPCAHRVFDTQKVMIGFCTRERNHKGKCSHLIPAATTHNLHKQTGLTYYMKEWDYK